MLMITIFCFVVDFIIQVLRDCERKHSMKDSNYRTLHDAISDRWV